MGVSQTLERGSECQLIPEQHGTPANTRATDGRLAPEQYASRGLRRPTCTQHSMPASTRAHVPRQRRRMFPPTGIGAPMHQPNTLTPGGAPCPPHRLTRADEETHGRRLTPEHVSGGSHRTQYASRWLKANTARRLAPAHTCLTSCAKYARKHRIALARRNTHASA